MRFDIPLAAAVVTTSYVIRDRMPVLEVTHEQGEEDDIVWQFHCGNSDYRPEFLRLVGLGQILRIDESLLSIADLPIGFCARRQFRGGVWHIEPIVTM